MPALDRLLAAVAGELARLATARPDRTSGLG